MPGPLPSNHLLECVVFDLDGTLIDSRDDIAAACNHALEAHGRAALPVEKVRSFVGDGARALLARAFGMQLTSAELDAPLATFNAYYAQHPVVATSFLPGVHETLDALSAKKVALATNKPRRVTLLVLEALGIGHRFDAVFAGGDGPLKPDPFGVHHVLGALGVAPSAAWMVGDGPQDIGAGKAAGCHASIAVLRGFVSAERIREAEPDVVLESLLEFPSLLRV